MYTYMYVLHILRSLKNGELILDTSTLHPSFHISINYEWIRASTKETFKCFFKSFVLENLPSAVCSMRIELTKQM